MSKRKPKLPKRRNPYVIPAKNRKGGPHKDKRKKRANENKRDDKYLEENY